LPVLRALTTLDGVAYEDRFEVELDGYVVEPLTPQRFDHLVAVLGKSGIGGCWCMYWTMPSSAAWGEGCKGGADASNKREFYDLLAAGPPPGLLAYDDQDPVAWCRVMSRSRLPGLANSRYFKTDLDVEGVWSLACFVVRKPYRRRGLTSVLTQAAIEFAREQGGRILEAYPWDTTDAKADSIVYTGLATTFDNLGFEVVQRLAPHKPMMRLSLT